MTTLSILADVNLWVATLVESHPHHALAVAWWRRTVLPVGANVALCRVTQLGVLRTLTNDRVMGAQTKSLPEAWAVVEQLLAQPRVYFAEEPKGLDALLSGDCAPDGSSS